MVFSIWFFVWLAHSDTAMHLLLPALALVIRIAYVERRFPTFPIVVMVFWLVLAAFTAVGGGGASSAVVLFLKVFLSTVAIFHLLNQLKRTKAIRTGKVGQLYFFLTRALVIVGARGREISYWFRTRVRLSEGPRVFAYFRYAPAAATAYMLEMMSVRNRFVAVMASKGGYPDSDDWLFEIGEGHSFFYTALGDVITLAAIGVAGSFHHSALVPPTLELLMRL
jgi:hypothetical protein